MAVQPQAVEDAPAGVQQEDRRQGQQQLAGVDRQPEAAKQVGEREGGGPVDVPDRDGVVVGGAERRDVARAEVGSQALAARGALLGV